MRMLIAAVASSLVASGVGLAGAAAPAAAAVVGTVEQYCPRTCPVGFTFEFVAATGEHNRVTVMQEDDGIVLHDAGALLVARDGCDEVDPHTVRCRTLLSGHQGSLALGDGDDELTSRVAVSADGGTGDDLLHIDATSASLDTVSLSGDDGDDRLSVAGDVAGRLSGDTGDDLLDAAAASKRVELVGGDGEDHLRGGAGDDVLTPGTGPDQLDGGPGQDRFSHADRDTPLVLALADRRSGEDPVVVAIEDVFGGSGDDVITGGDGANELGGGSGSDVLVSGGGDDYLVGDAGSDTLDGGANADQLDGGGGRDQISCGSERDRVAAGHLDRLVSAGPAGDVTATDCETLDLSSNARGPYCLALDAIERHGPALRVPDTCRGHRIWRRINARAVELRSDADRPLAAGLQPPGRSPLKLQLTRAGRSLLAPDSLTDVRLSVRRVGAHGARSRPTTVQMVLAVR